MIKFSTLQEELERRVYDVIKRLQPQATFYDINRVAGVSVGNLSTILRHLEKRRLIEIIGTALQGQGWNARNYRTINPYTEEPEWEIPQPTALTITEQRVLQAIERASVPISAQQLITELGINEYVFGGAIRKLRGRGLINFNRYRSHMYYSVADNPR